MEPSRDDARPDGAAPGIDSPAGDAIVRSTFDTAPDAVVVLGRDQSVLVWNPSFRALWNFAPGVLERGDLAAIRSHIAELLLDPEAYRLSHEPLRHTAQSQFFDVVALRDGRVFERHVSPMGAVAGVPQADGGVIVRWRDVTQRQQVEQALARTAAAQQRVMQQRMELATLLDLALTSAELAYWDVDLSLRRVNSANERWYSMLGYSAGEIVDELSAWDAMVHPDDADARLLAWEAHLDGHAPRFEAEFRMRHKDGNWVWLQARGQAVARGPDGRATRLVGTRQDISVRKRAEQWLQSLAHTDELTGIHNRRRFKDLAAGELARARRHGHSVALLMIDLDHFKAINDRFGHEGGDEVLRSFVQTARTVMRQSDVFARIGGEEFAALLPYANAEGACVIAERLLQQTLEQPCRLGHESVAYSVSIGVAVAQQSEDAAPLTVQALMRAADRALYHAKALGRARVVLDAA